MSIRFRQTNNCLNVQQEMNTRQLRIRKIIKYNLLIICCQIISMAILIKQNSKKGLQVQMVDIISAIIRMCLV